MQDQVRFASAALEAGREIEQAEGAAMRERWWRAVVVPRIEATGRELRARRDRPPAAVDVERWRRVARLPVLVRAVPGFGDLWALEAPVEAVERLGDVVWVTPSCGQRVLLPVEVVVVCPDDCGRWMLLLRNGSVRVKAWPREAGA
jgi:hypothetical protein